ncbi:hypothetical protein [Aeromonas hydrophila]|uniref:hypothetical protein n=1 Tax=Aeromonas hydrophila TaxID=644 RepID=UPI002B484BEF|nr:hypothetical protein [Aeromonas hydrophila]
MSYELSVEDVNSVSDAELAFSTVRFLPKWDDIPDGFKDGNRYTKFVEKLFYGSGLPEYEIEIKMDITPEALRKCILAHVNSFAPKHEHKIAGVGFMLYQMCSLSHKA